MNEWLNSMWEWILDNKVNITTFFTSTNFVTIMSMLIAFVKNIQATKNNTLSIKSVNNTMQENQVIKSDVVYIKDEVPVLKTELDATKTELKRAHEKLDKMEKLVKQYNEELFTKVNAMLEVQNIVYATIKDDNIRTSVNSILIAAKHSDNASKIKLQEELDTLRDELKAKNAELDAAVNRVVEKVANEVTATPTQTEESTAEIRRY